MQIISYVDSWKDKWDCFVKSNPCSWTGHFSGMFALERETAVALNKSFMIIDEKDQIVALLPLFLLVQRELRIIPVRILCSGTHLASGPLFFHPLAKKKKKKITRLLMDHVLELGETFNVDQIVISYPNIINGKTSLDEFKYYPLKHYGFREKNVVPMIKKIAFPENDLFASLSSNCRNMIRRAQKSSVDFQHVTSRDEWMSFYNLNVETLGDRAYSRKTMEIIWDEFVLHDIANVTAVISNGIAVSVALTTCWKDSFYYWFGFNSKTDRIPGVANLLLWKTMLFYQQKGLKFFEVGSMEFSSGKQKTISAFKESFNGTPTYMLSGTLNFKPVKSQFVALLKQLRG